MSLTAEALPFAAYETVSPQPPAIADEQTLLDRLRAESPANFEELVRSNIGPMLSAARRILQSEEDAHEAVQDAFLNAFEHLKDFRGDSRLSTWLYRIAVNASLMKLRSRRRRREESIDPLLPRFDRDNHRIDPGPDGWRDQDDPVDRQRTIDLVRSCIDQLPESYRTLLVLRDVEGFSTDEAARALGLSYAGAKTKLHRARQALRALLDPHLRRRDS